jgi:regulator of cell morphogenesis and NO signaling
MTEDLHGQPAVAGETVRAALEREHHEIDRGVEGFLAAEDAASDGLRAAMTALRRHIYLGEELLFPPLRDAGLLAPVFVMLNEHGELWRAMDALEQQLDSGVPHVDLYDAGSALLAQLDAHNTKEEPILYGRADEVLSEDAAAELHDFLAHEALPDGWTCGRL